MIAVGALRDAGIVIVGAIPVGALREAPLQFCRRFIGIELDATFYEVSKARIEDAGRQFRLPLAVPEQVE